MVESQVSVGGGVIFWSLAQWYDRAALAGGLAMIDLQALTPPPRPIVGCLRAALASSYRGRQHLVSPLKERGALEVVRVDHVAADRNEYPQVLCARVSEDEQGNPRVTISPYDPTTAGVILQEFEQARGLVSGEAISEILTRYAVQLGGTRLRPVGGIYWLPEHTLAAWRRLTDVVESSSSRGRCSCYVIRHAMDTDAVRAVRDAIEQELARECQEIWDDVSGGSLGARALENRKLQAEELAEKLGLYEGLLDQSLSSSRTAIENARNAAAAAAMLASAETEPVA